MATLRINEETHATIKGMAEVEGISMQNVLEQAIEAFRRQRFLQAANVAYLTLQEDSDAWREEMKEREVWESTLADGIEQE